MAKSNRIEEERNAFFERANKIRQAITSGKQWVEEHIHHDTPEARRRAEEAHEERVLRAKQRLGRDFGDLMFRAEQNIPRYREILKERSNGGLPVYDPTEVPGEIPTPDVPAQLVFEKHELNPPGPRILRLRESLHLHNLGKELHDHRRLVIATTTATGGLLLLVGGYFSVKHVLDKNPHADITDSKNPS